MLVIDNIINKIANKTIYLLYMGIHRIAGSIHGTIPGLVPPGEV